MEIFDQLKPFIDWIHDNPMLAWLATFLISLAESLAIIGMIIPGTVMMTAIGILIGAGVVDFWSIMIAAILGAIVGDSLSYRIGYYFNTHIRDMWPFRRHPRLLAKGEEFFQKHGGKSVFLGRFVGPIRAMVPVIAGMMRMPGLRFVCSNVFSAILWAPFYMLPGMLIGYASLELDPQTTTRFVVTLVVGLIVIGSTAWLFKWIVDRVLTFLDRLLDRLWAFMKHHRTIKPLCTLLADPRHPEGHGQLTLAVVTLIFITLFILFAIQVNTTDQWTNFKVAYYHIAQSFATIKGLKIATMITELGNKYILLITLLLVSAWLLRKSYYWAALHILVVLTLTVLSAAALKIWIESTRPGLLSFDKNSFPSAHTALSIGCYGFFTVLISRDLSKYWRIGMFTFTTLLCFLVALSRIYLGQHWITDVMAGCLLGFICASITTISYCRRITVPIPLFSTITLFIASITLGMAWIIVTDSPIGSSTDDPLRHQQTISMQDWWYTDNQSIPFYRRSRSGKPLELFNVQWADTPDNIAKVLSTDGWQALPKLTVIAAIDSITSNEKDSQLPYFLPQLNNGEKSLLTMYKELVFNDVNVLVVLRLWPGNMIFIDSTLPLLVGSIHYQLPRKHYFWKHKNHKMIKQQLEPATQLLANKQIKKQYELHQIIYPMVSREKSISSHNEWLGGVLYLRPQGWRNFKIIHHGYYMPFSGRLAYL